LQWLTAKNLRTAADTEGRLEKHVLHQNRVDAWIAVALGARKNSESQLGGVEIAAAFENS
jgi:hypothetical protein